MAACDIADGRNSDDLAHLGSADIDISELRSEHTLDSGLDLLDAVVDDTVEAHIDTVALCVLFCDRVRADIEADDDGV